MKTSNKESRNRSQGWKYAKLSGHFNEEMIAEHIKNHPDYARKLLFRLGIMDNSVVDVQAGGLKEKMVGSVLGGSTIQLPFGFVRWHSPSKTIPGQMQFHHSFSKISQLFETVR